jgi:beta-N-acetylhexosaminidase
MIRLALGAGNDLAMICHRIECVREAHDVLQTLPPVQLDRALENVARFKKKLAPPDAFSEEEFLRRDAEVRELRAAVLGAEAADQHSAEDGKRSPVEIY